MRKLNRSISWRREASEVLDLRNYPHFAEFGLEALAQPAGAPSEQDYDSKFEQFAAESLRDTVGRRTHRLVAPDTGSILRS
ncbi:MAG: hypothetical protein ACOC3I_04455 [Verrucomicrobiota bacterium]